MADIVERLRAKAGTLKTESGRDIPIGAALLEAAAEIERLTTANQTARSEIAKLLVANQQMREALREWRNARAETCEAGIKHSEYMVRLNRLSDAEDRLSSLTAALKHGGDNGPVDNGESR